MYKIKEILGDFPITHKPREATIVVILLLIKLIGLPSVLKNKYQAFHKRLWVILLYASLEINQTWKTGNKYSRPHGIQQRHHSYSGFSRKTWGMRSAWAASRKTKRKRRPSWKVFCRCSFFPPLCTAAVCGQSLGRQSAGAAGSALRSRWFPARKHSARSRPRSADRRLGAWESGKALAGSRKPRCDVSEESKSLILVYLF